MRNVIFATFLGLVFFATSLLAEEKRVIDLEEGMIGKYISGTQLPIIGLRSAAASFVSAQQVRNDQDTDYNSLYIPERVIVASWLKDQKFAQSASKSGASKNTSIEEIFKKGFKIEKFDWEPVDQDAKSVKPFLLKEIGIDESPKASSKEIIDAQAIIALTKAGQIDFTKSYDAVFIDGNHRVFKVTDDLARAVPLTFQAAQKKQDSVLSDPKNNWENANSVMDQASFKLPIKDAKELYVALGAATFGTVRMQSAEEVGLKVDDNIAKISDTYLLRFAVTFYDLPTNNLDEISFRVKCANECTAWELAPSRVVKQDEETTSLNTPKIGFEGFEIGEFFRKQIVSKSIKPQVIAYGLQENEFSWSLKDDAIQSGSNVFAAAISVPKGTTILQLDRSIAVKTTHFAGLVEGDWASTDKLSQDVVLRP